MKRPLTYDDEKCGLGCLKLAACQKLADIRIFVALMCVVIGVQGTYLGYAVGVLTTLEKRFEISSSEAGLLLAMYDIGHTCTVMLVGYCLADRHKPRWTAYGVLLSSLAMFSWTLPNFIFGPVPLAGAGQDYVNSTKCDPKRVDTSDLASPSCKAAHYEAYIILCFAQLFSGIAAAPFNTISYIYIDDNVSNRNSPFYLGLLTSMYAFGPAIGFGLSSLCNLLHADLQTPIGIDSDSPSWIGAWWLGFIFCGVLYLLTALPLMCFPYRIPDKRTLVAKMEANLMVQNGVPEKRSDYDAQSYQVSCFRRLKATTKDLPFAIWHVMKNPVFSSMVVSWIFGSYLVGGYGTFLPQYIETQYSVSASIADLCACLISIGSVALSTAVGGYLLSRFDIKPRRATLYLLATWSVIVITYLLGMVAGCKETSLEGTFVNGKYVYSNDCNENCNCQFSMDYDPVYSGNTTYFSACYAGCKNYNSSSKAWTNCTCTGGYNNVIKGIFNDCTFYLPIYLTIMFVGFFIGNLFFMTTMMVVLRCVEDEERSLALSFASCLTNLFGFIPSPIIFGAIIDSSCNVWHSQCPNERGSCIQYDNNSFRVKYHSSNAGFQFIAICSLLVCYIVTRTFKFPEERHDEEYEFDDHNSEQNQRHDELTT